jgi:hypothetical protein
LASKEWAATIQRHVSSGAGMALARSRRAAGAGIAGPITGQDPGPELGALLLLQVVAKLLGAARMSKLAECIALDLPDSLASQPEALADLL